MEHHTHSEPAQGHGHEHHHHDQTEGSHGHSHGHGGHSHHHHAPATFDQAFAVGTFLNLAYVMVQAYYGFRSHSVSLLADAGHNLSDVLGLLLAWAASRLYQVKATEKRTYGLRRFSILAALANASLLLFSIGAISWEAIRHLAHPVEVAGMTVTIVAGVGILINAGTAWLFASGRKGDLNIRGAFLHMASDAVVSAGVVVAGLVITFTHWQWLDPVVSLLISAFIVYGTWGLLQDSVNLALDAVPPGVNLLAIRSFLSKQPGVVGVHDLHVWALSTTENALTAHIVRSTEDSTEFLTEVIKELKEDFKISHTTLQIERDHSDFACGQSCENR